MWNGDKRLQTQVLDIAENTVAIRSLDWDRDRFDIEFACATALPCCSFSVLFRTRRTSNRGIPILGNLEQELPEHFFWSNMTPTTKGLFSKQRRAVHAGDRDDEHLERTPRT